MARRKLAIVKPQVVVCLGATAAKALLGPAFLVTRNRGEFVPSPLAPYVMATLHPSAVLRAPDEATRRIQREQLASDLEKVLRVLT